MKVKVNEASGHVLDWLAAKCDNRQIGFNLGGGLEVRGRTEDGEELPDHWDLWMPWHPSTDWSLGGPIIEREKITLNYDNCGPTLIWEAKHFAFDGTQLQCEYGDTPLIAAMRCYVASKLGDEVEVPHELA